MATRRRNTTANRFVQLPLMGSAAIYARVDQPQAAHPDPVETLRTYAQELGYAGEQIPAYTDTSEQAAAPLKTRQGYRALLKAIGEGEVNVLYLYAEGRILKGADELQVNTFIHLCIEKGIFIVTPQATYDFQDLSHIVQFRATCLLAGKEVEQVIQQTTEGKH